MPQKNNDYTMPYDLAAWRARCGGSNGPMTKRDAAHALGISYATISRAEKDGQVQKQMAWACTGIELTLKRQREQANAS